MTATNIDDDRVPVSILMIKLQLAATYVGAFRRIEMAASRTETAGQPRLADTLGVGVVESGTEREGASP